MTLPRGRGWEKYISRTSPTLSRSSVWKASAITMTATVWGIRSGRKRRLSAVRWKAASIREQALYFQLRHRPPDVWDLRFRAGIADTEEDPYIRPPPLCWRHCLPLGGWWCGGRLHLEGLLQQDIPLRRTGDPWFWAG